MDNTLNIGTIIKSPNYDYKILNVLGQGAFGITYLAETSVVTTTIIEGPLGCVSNKKATTMQVAIKEFFMKDICGRNNDGSIVDSSSSPLVSDYRKKFHREAENLSKMQHEGIVRVIEVFEFNNTSYYSMEYISGGSFDAYIASKNGLSENEALACIKDLGTALSYMHGKHMLHLDLKPKNIMRRPDGKLVLIDFGLSKSYNANGEAESSTTVGLGTAGYAPLEQAQQQNGQHFPTYIDVYALGATLYKSITGQTPPNASRIMNEGFPVSELLDQHVSKSTIDFIKKSMEPRWIDRFHTITDMINELSDSSIKEHNPHTLENTSFIPEQHATMPNIPKTKEKNKWYIWIIIALAALIIVIGFTLSSKNDYKEKVRQEIQIEAKERARERREILESDKNKDDASESTLPNQRNKVISEIESHKTEASSARSEQESKSSTPQRNVLPTPKPAPKTKANKSSKNSSSKEEEDVINIMTNGQADAGKKEQAKPNGEDLIQKKKDSQNKDKKTDPKKKMESIVLGIND